MVRASVMPDRGTFRQATGVQVVGEVPPKADPPSNLRPE